MMKPYNLLALNPNQDAELDLFYELLQEHFSHLFYISISPSFSLEKSSAFHAVIATEENQTIALPHLVFTRAELTNLHLDKSDKLLDLKQFSALNVKVTNFYFAIGNQLLNSYPFQVRLADQDGQIIRHNHQFNGSFFEDDHQEIESWIQKQLAKPNGIDQKHFLLPSASADHIYYQSYYALKDKQGTYLGSLDYVQDIKPILADYLEETAQAIVGWSDVTSGPSISNDF